MLSSITSKRRIQMDIKRKMVDVTEPAEPKEEELAKLSKSRETNWPAVLFLIHVHLLSGYAIWLLFHEVKWLTFAFLITLSSLGILGMTTGAHRLWAHRSYTAAPELRFVLMLLQTMAGLGPIYSWVQSHRLHHEQFGTDVDPFDHSKGFLYAQILSRMRNLSPYQEKLKESIDMSDLENDRIVMFQKNFYWLLYPILFLLLPLNAPLEYWNESVLCTVFVIGFLRYGVILHAAWLIESSICIWGLKPGEKNPPDSNAIFIITKSYWPQYHYLIPYDYKVGEYGSYDGGCSSAFIRVFAALRLATNLRTVETPTLQKALAMMAKTKLPLQTCLEETLEAQRLAKDSFLSPQ